MDARDQLRRFLEQRREQGERELVLDGMSVDDVLRILGASGGSGKDRRPQESADPVSDARRPRESGDPATLDSRARVNDDQPVAADWRQALRDAERAKPRPGEPANSAGMEPSPAPGAAQPLGTAPTSGTVSGSGSGSQRGSPESSSRPQPVPGSALDSIAPAGIVVGRPVADVASIERALATLDEVTATIARCTRCPLYSTATNPVPGEGSPTADLMCVGEAPGQTEDETGRPFVGAAGQLLTKILAAIDLPREEAFIVNVLKHRPPGNRNPRPEEVEACSPYLVRQIELVQPKVIVAFGTFAAQTLLGTKLAIGKLRGSIHRYFGVPLIVTYHPAALLRNPAWKRPTWEDVQLARRILDLPAAD